MTLLLDAPSWTQSGAYERPRLELRLLGGFEAYVNGRPVLGFESDKSRALLAYLAAEGGRPHRRDRLAALLWPRQAGDVAPHRLRQALSNVRSVLGDSDAGAPILLVTRTELRLNQSAGVWLDVAELDALLATCRQHRHRSAETCRACVRRLDRAVELCRGTFLEGVTVEESEAFEEWVTTRKEHVEQQLAAALVWLAGHHERQGDYERVQEYAERRLRLEPWAEEAHRQVMRALALNGQRTAALRHYQRCRDALQEELGIEPSAETQALARQLERGRLPAAAPEPAHNLPAQLTRLVGREREVAELEELLSVERLVTLVGMGGCGKTRLALEVAAGMRRDFKDGVWLVELAPVADAAQVPRAVARVFGVGEDAKHSAAENLAAHLRGKDALLVLDNCEQVVGACAALADHLLRACPALCLLATSREALRISGEHVMQVLPLPVEDLELTGASPERLLEVMSASGAVQLFVERAAAVNPDLTLTAETAPAMAGICRELDGIPLALELAATWAGTLSVADIWRRLVDRFRLLDGGTRTADARHQTLEGLIDWSYELLTPAERAAFLRLGVFAGGGPLDAAEVVCADGAADEPLHSLRGLAAKSMMRFDADGGRFRLLDTLRHYARRRLETEGGAAAAEGAHARYFLALAETHAARSKWAGRVDRAAQEAIDRERDNMHLALAWARRVGEGETELRLASALAWFWYTTGQLVSGGEHLEHALEIGIGGTPDSAPALRRERANALLARGYIARLSGDRAVAQARLAEALRLCRELGEDAGTAGAARGLAFSHEDYAAARALFDEAEVIYRAAGNEERIAWVTQEQGWVASFFGDTERARTLLEESRERLTRLRDTRGVMYSAGVLGAVLLDLGDASGAQKELAQALALVLGTKDRIFAPYLLEICAALALEAGSAERALGLLAAASAIRGRNAHPPLAAQAERVRQVDARAREALDLATATSVWSRGEAMTLEEALAEALPAEPAFPEG